MTPYVEVQNLVSSGPKSWKEIMASTGWKVKKANAVLNQLIERRDIRRIGRGVYAMPNHSLIKKKQIK